MPQFLDKLSDAWSKLVNSLPFYIGLLAFATAIVCLGFLVKLIAEKNGATGTFDLSTLALLGVLALLGALLVFTTVVHAIGLSNQQQALGLPEGSVRAILALALVGLFAILASSALTKPNPVTVDGLRAAEVTELVKSNSEIIKIQKVTAAQGEPTFQVVFSAPAHLDDYAKQVLTLIGTLMTAVISFYFGTTSSSTPTAIPRGNNGGGNGSGNSGTGNSGGSGGSGDGGDGGGKGGQNGPPSPTAITPPSGQTGITQTYTVTGTGLSNINKVDATPANGGPAVSASNVTANETAVTFDLTLPTAGAWTVALLTGTGTPIAVSGSITIS